MLDNPPQPEAARMQEEDDEVQASPSPVIGKGTSQYSGGDPAGLPVEEDDDDRVLLNQRLKWS